MGMSNKAACMCTHGHAQICACMHWITCRYAVRLQDTHTHTHTCTHTHTHTHPQKETHARTCAPRTHKQMHSNSHAALTLPPDTNAHKCFLHTPTHTGARTCAPPHTHNHTRAHTYTHTHPHWLRDEVEGLFYSAEQSLQPGNRSIAFTSRLGNNIDIQKYTR